MTTTAQELNHTELTEEEAIENAKKERREKYVATQRYINGDKFKDFIAKFVAKGEALTQVIKDEIANRKELKASKSEMDIIHHTILFYGEILAELGLEDGERVFADILEQQVEAGWTNILNKVEELGDVPIYTVLDFTKQKRIDYLKLEYRFRNWSEAFADKKVEAAVLHPYEEEKAA